MKITVGTLLVGAMLVAGCAENEESLLVLNAPFWDPSSPCGVMPNMNMNGQSLSSGLLDLAYRTPYVMPATLLNNTAPQEIDDNNSGIMSNELQLIDADVDLSLAQAPEIIDQLEAENGALVSFNVPLPTVSIFPGQQQAVIVEVVPQPTSVALAEAIEAAFGLESRLTLEAKVAFHASRSGNTIGKVGDVDARDFSFPIQMCFGCLLTCSTCEGGMCPVGEFSVAGGVCGNAQDRPLYPSACDEPN